jgi:hypothetical protein
LFLSVVIDRFNGTVHNGIGIPRVVVEVSIASRAGQSGRAGEIVLSD